MTRTLQKHIARRQDQTFADWFAELKELAGERWADVADQAPTIYASRLYDKLNEAEFKAEKTHGRRPSERNYSSLGEYELDKYLEELLSQPDGDRWRLCRT